MNAIRLSVVLLALITLLTVAVGPLATPAHADGTADNGQDPPAALLEPTEGLLNDAAALVRVLVSVIL